MVDKYLCNTCNKIYTSRQSLWNHNNKYHKQQCHQNVTKCNKISTDCHQNVTKCNKISTDNHEINIFECKYCNKNLSNRQSRWRHEVKCINTNSNKEDNSKKIIEELKNQITEIQLQLSDVLKYAKIRPGSKEPRGF